MEFLPVRFHLGGEFVHYGQAIDFVGGDEAWSYIEREKVSMCELVANLKRHMIITDKDSIFLRWLFPGKDLVNGLRPLNDDKECSYMLQCITDGVVSDIYAEVVHENSEEEDESDSDYEIEEESASEADDHAITVPIAIASRNLQVGNNFDSDWEDNDSENSDEDQEAKQYRRNAKMVKKRIKGREEICEALVQAGHHVPQSIDEDLDVGSDTPYFDSSEEASYDDEEVPESSGCRRKSRFPRFDDTAPIPIFTVGMTFRGREEFKQGVVNYGLALKRHIAFPKDEKKRIRAKCPEGFALT
ncbi:unnamed protein product [Urochloa humidicola]